MIKKEIINELNKQNIELGEELSLVKDRLNKILFEKEKVEQENQQLKKQKDDVIEYLKKRITYDPLCNMEVETYISPKKILRMLGEKE